MVLGSITGIACGVTVIYPSEAFALRAWIRLKPGVTAAEDGIRGFCRRQTTHFRIPCHVRFADTCPMPGTGRIRTFVMRTVMAQELAAA